MKEKIKVLMVCHGIIYRSPIAEFVMKYLSKETTNVLTRKFVVSNCQKYKYSS